MMKTMLLLLIGAAGGYYYGFHDAKTHDTPVVTRVVQQAVGRAGGSHRGAYKTDVDAQMERAEH